MVAVVDVEAVVVVDGVAAGVAVFAWVALGDVDEPVKDEAGLGGGEFVDWYAGDGHGLPVVEGHVVEFAEAVQPVGDVSAQFRG